METADTADAADASVMEVPMEEDDASTLIIVTDDEDDHVHCCFADKFPQYTCFVTGYYIFLDECLQINVRASTHWIKLVNIHN